MLRNIRGRKRDSTVKELVENSIGKNPAINAEKRGAVSFVVICLLIRYTIIGSEAKKRLGRIFAANSNGIKNVKKATK